MINFEYFQVPMSTTVRAINVKYVDDVMQTASLSVFASVTWTDPSLAWNRSVLVFGI